MSPVSLKSLLACAAHAAYAGVVLAGAAGCSGSGAGAGAPASSGTTTTIKLVQNTWDASRLDVAVAGVLLTEELGLTVEVTEIDEFSQWPYFASGAEHACLEVWPSGHAADIAQYIATGEVENGGALGPVGKISWYVPTYLLTQTPGAATAEFFADPANTAPFATSQTGSKGQLLSGDPSWTSYDAEIIENLGLNLELVYAGTEEKELDVLAEAYENRRAILLYLWAPHAALVKYELTPVTLPPHTAACYAKIPTGGVDCDYPPDPLFKIFWPGLKVASPRAYQLLKNLTLTGIDQIDAEPRGRSFQQYQCVQAANLVARPAREHDDLEVLDPLAVTERPHKPSVHPASIAP